MIEVFTDGSADNMKKDVGGIGVYFYDKNLHKHNISEKYVCKKCTNIKMELTACIKAIEKVIEFSDTKNKKVWDLTIYTDSKYTMDAMLKYAPSWIKMGWKKSNGSDIQNLDEIKKLYVLTACYKINYVHVRSHKAEPKNRDSDEWRLWFGNSMADKLANDARNS